MDLDEYFNHFGDKACFFRHRPSLAQGMLLFDETASCFAGPFAGNYVYYRVCDHRTDRYPLRTIEEHKQYIRFRSLGNPVASEQHLQRRLEQLSSKELKAWELRMSNIRLDVATIENPYSFYLAGNDDSSYTKFFPTHEAVMEELELFLVDQPLNYEVHVEDNGFIFTN